MEEQKILNLLEETDDDDILKFQTKIGILVMIKIMVNMVKEMKTILQLNLIQK